MVEPTTLPRVIAPVVQGNRIQAARGSEDRKRGFAFSNQLRKERRKHASPDDAGSEERAEGERSETGAPPDASVAEEIRPAESADAETQIKMIDIRV